MKFGLEQSSEPWLSPPLDTVGLWLGVLVEISERPLCKQEKNPQSISGVHQARERAFAGLKNS